MLVAFPPLHSPIPFRVSSLSSTSLFPFFSLSPLTGPMRSTVQDTRPAIPGRLNVDQTGSSIFRTARTRSDANELRIKVVTRIYEPSVGNYVSIDANRLDWRMVLFPAGCLSNFRLIFHLDLILSFLSRVFSHLRVYHNSNITRLPLIYREIWNLSTKKKEYKTSWYL